MAMTDIRDMLFEQSTKRRVTARIFADNDGVLACVDKAVSRAEDLGLTVTYSAAPGAEVIAGDMLMEFYGSPKAVVSAEDCLIGIMAKASGIAAAAHRFVHEAQGMRIVCGSWKKMPPELKTYVREAIQTGEASIRISDEPMVYLDKNYVRILGGIQGSLRAAEKVNGRKKVIQIRGFYENGDIVREAFSALSAGADIIFVDTGNIEDAKNVCAAILPVLKKWETDYEYRHVEIAYAGGVTLEQLSDLRQYGVDIVGVGRAIIDAPLLDMHLDVVDVEADEYDHSYDLLDKSELLIEGIRLHGSNLNLISDTVADIVGTAPDEVLVIDVRDDTVALDILRRQVDPHCFIGKERFLLEKLSQIKGVELLEGAKITSRGMLGWIADNDETRLSAIENANHMAEAIRKKASMKAIVFPSGAEVENGEIEDTNTPLLAERLTAAGFTVTRGDVLIDDIDLFSGKLRQAAERGYGLIITTGGVGAENKDHSVEAIERLDKNAATPFIAKFRVGDGRHKKPGIRIGVGQYGVSTLVALPGPNDEVKLCIDTLIEGMHAGWSKELLAARLAEILRKRLREKIGIHCPHHTQG